MDSQSVVGAGDAVALGRAEKSHGGSCEVKVFEDSGVTTSDELIQLDMFLSRSST
jgi:hypothetical protein